MTRRASDRRLKLRGSNGVPTLVVNQMSLQTTPPQRGNWRTPLQRPSCLLPRCRGSRLLAAGPQLSPSGMSGAVPQDRTKHGRGAAYDLILLTDLLTADLDNPGYSWTKAPYATLRAGLPDDCGLIWTGEILLRIRRLGFESCRRSAGRPRSAPAGQRALDRTRAQTRFRQARLESGHRREEGNPAERRRTRVPCHAQAC